MRPILTLLSVLFISSPAYAAELPEMDAEAIIAAVNTRDDGQQLTRKFKVELTNRSGKTRTEEMVAFRRYFGDEKRTVIFYTEPTRVRGTGFLTFDYADPKADDDQWLYLPALRKVRRISASDRGDYFLGTDFTYEEIKKEQKVQDTDYVFESVGTGMLDGSEVYIVKGIPANDDTARELGVSYVVWRIDPEIWMTRKTEYYDRNGNLARTITLEGYDTIDGYLTATKLRAENHKTGHSSVFTFDDSDYETDVSDRIFSQARLRRGL
ncbi:hypothetical protein GCM10007853_21120 [Algimonas ampicilliniresistens]|uniref:Uncharacterized protein TP-0789 domain-containing protein n=1 Tax=Algimonas ampicilliniresistens TaxID=1298735 RepID=A0ABQ5V9W3_9PROT|nr:outer membrane lipoprotein-sorting protein [Algimonas ampicilliniresistens]GLQ24238.1 hypothetical protein GCM10007853_21120 [Algimonas ampicilliniresistens]